MIDCDADLGTDSEGNAGNDCIGGASYRASIVRFYWKPTMVKGTALDIAAPNAGVASLSMYDCNNESEKDVLLEGCSQSVIHGCRFNNPGSGNELWIRSNILYTQSGNTTITNPFEIVVANCIFANSTCKVHFEGGDNGHPAHTTTLVGGRVAIVNNTFDGSGYSPIQWAGDDVSTSVGGSIVSGNAIAGANQSGSTTPQEIIDAIGNNLGYLWASGISILSSYGLVVDHNTIEDTASPPQMLFSIQLARQDAAQPGQTQRILVQGNLCGYAPASGHGTTATFYLGAYASGSNPLPILLNNTNQLLGYDATASGSIATGTAWPPAEGYPYNAFVTVTGTAAVKVGTEATGLTNGSFYIPVGQTITVTFSESTTIRVFTS